MLRIDKPPPPSSLDVLFLNESNPFQDIQDLELAAELGRTLLERNGELENDLKTQQSVIDDQAQEIEFLTKQNSTMKEESSARSKFYEQLESTIFELERTNVQLSRKHEVDKKRIQSLCENIDYLERKCEEMTGTLETIRDESKKSYGTGKMSRSSYLSYNGSDSSEDDSFTFLFKRRSHSLHDLRDFNTPSPDELDSNNSHSPELKASETEFIESLETKIELLMSVKKKEQDKVHQMEAQMRILIQENANLQEQLNLVQREKEEQITELRNELRKQLLDTSNYAQQTLSMASQLCLPSSLSSTQTPNSDNQEEKQSHTSSSSQSPHSNSDSGLETWTHSPLAIVLNHGNQDESLQQQSAWTNFHKKLISDAVQFQFPPCATNVLCKRCSAEINLLNLVQSIEVENDDEVENLDIEADEFNSLEHELARATGHHNSLSYLNPSSRRCQNNNKNNNNHRNNSDNSDSSSHGRESSSSSTLWPWGLRRPSLLDLFISDRAEEEEIGEEACETQVDFSVCSSKSKTNAEIDDDEDPCLRKDRGPEKEKMNGLCCRRRTDQNNKLKYKKLQLPQKIPHEDSEMNEGFQQDHDKNKVSQLLCRRNHSNNFEETDEHDDTSSLYLATSEKLQEKEGVINKKMKLAPTESSKKKKGIGISVHFQMDEEEAEDFSDACDCGFNCGGIVEEAIVQSTELITPCPPVSVFLTPVPASETIEEEASSLFSALSSLSSLSSTCALTDGSSLSSQPLRNSMVPEYKEILDTMFNLFQNSRQTYPPTPAYPFNVQGKRSSKQ